MSQEPYATLIPLIRRELWSPDGKPPAGWDDRREGSVLKRLLVHRSKSQVEVAILGLAQLRDSGQVDWLKRGDKVTCRALYNTRNGVSQMFELATAAYWVKAKKKRPRPQMESMGDVIFGIMAYSGKYKAYLQSPEWRATRERVLARAGLRCERCQSYGDGLDVHHLRYTSLGHEPDEDLEVLCRPCHNAADAERKRRAAS